MTKKSGKQYWGPILVMVGPTALWLVAFLLIPLIYVVAISFMTKGAYGGVVPEFTISSYQKVFSALYMKVTWKSLVMAFESAAVCLLIGYPFAWFLCKASPKTSGLLMLLIILPFWVNGLIRLNGWNSILRDSGFLNTVLLQLGIIEKPLAIMKTDFAVLLGMVYCLFPFMVLPLHSSISKLDHALVEAAMDLGAGRVRTFWRVVLPQTLPGIFAGTIQVFIPSLGAYFVADVMGGGNGTYLGNLIQNQFLTARNWPMGAALSVLLIVFTLVILKLYTKVGSLDDLG